MAQELFEALIGPEQPEYDPKMLAALLRRNDQMGMLASLSGDKPLMGVGNMVNANTQSAVTQLQDTRQKNSQRRMMQKYYDALEKQMADNVKLQREEFALRRELEGNRNLTTLAAGMRAGKPKELKVSDRRDIRDQVIQLDEIRNLAADLGGGSWIKPPSLAGMQIPGAGSARNFLSANAPSFMDSNSKKAQDWWARWDRIYNLPVRNKTFGATLTATEKAAWAQANINPNMEPAQIANGVKQILDIMSDKTGLMYDDYTVSGYDVDTQFEPVLDLIRGGMPPEDAGEAPAPSTPRAAPQPVPQPTGAKTKVIGGKTFVQGPDGEWYAD